VARDGLADAIADVEGMCFVMPNERLMMRNTARERERTGDGTAEGAKCETRTDATKARNVRV
jgi:hypothetical protein